MPKSKTITTTTTTTLKPLIKVNDLTKKYGKKIVLNHLNLTFHQGERIALVGANGAGKSTFVEIISQSRKPTSGKVEYFMGNKQNLKRNIGIQFQESVWPQGITLKDVLKFFIGVYESILAEHVEKLVDLFQVREFYKKNIASLSGGQKQRINALLAIIHDPQLVILDELTTGLDIKSSIEIINYIKKAVQQKSKTLIIVSHRPDEIEQLCERIILLHQGDILIDNSLKNIEAKFGSLNQMLIDYFAGNIKASFISRKKLN